MEPLNLDSDRYAQSQSPPDYNDFVAQSKPNQLFNVKVRPDLESYLQRIRTAYGAEIARETEAVLTQPSGLKDRTWFCQRYLGRGGFATAATYTKLDENRDISDVCISKSPS